MRKLMQIVDGYNYHGLENGTVVEFIRESKTEGFAYGYEVRKLGGITNIKVLPENVESLA